MADDVFKNIRVLRGLTVDEFMGTMGFIAAALSMNCSECHDTSSTEAYALDNPLKQKTRQMIGMVNAFNKGYFGGKREVTCYSCHRGDIRPRITPRLSDQYGTPPPSDPNDVEVGEKPNPKAPTADQVLDKYLQALGGAQRVASLTSFVGQGNYEGFDTQGDKVPVDVYAKFPNQRTTVVHLQTGDNIRTFDGTNYWTTSAGTLLPIPVLAMSGGELAGARIDAALSFPSRIKQALKDWRSGFPSTMIDDNDVDVIQGMNTDNSPVKLYFDKKTGLLLRQLRFSNTPIGLNPTQVDYGDYREVAGVKIPFYWKVTWTDGQSTTQLTNVEANVTIDAARFARPAPASQR